MNQFSNQPESRQEDDFGLPQQPHESTDRNGKMWILILLLAVASLAAGGGYWFWYRPMIAHEPVALQKEEMMAAPDQTEERVDTSDFMEYDEEDNKDAMATDTAKPMEGALHRINTPQGRYYVVVGSFIDEDMALDHAEDLRKQGGQVYVLSPKKNSYFFRVAVAEDTTLKEANRSLEQFKPIHGMNTWVVKH